MSVRDTDRGYDALLKRMSRASVDIDVGIHRPQADQPHPGGDRTIGQVAAAHETGTNVPRRPFVSGYFDDREREIDNATLKATQAVFRNTDPKTAYKRLGDEMVRGMQDNMQRVGPPLAASTVRRKGHNRRLEETGTMAKAITAKVIPK